MFSAYIFVWSVPVIHTVIHTDIIAIMTCTVVWCGVVWCGVVWCGVVWCGVV